MPDNLDNINIAKATIPVEANFDEFKRQADEALEEITRKFDTAIDAIAKGMGEKLGAAMRDIDTRLEGILERAGNFTQTQPSSVTKQEPDSPGRDLTEVVNQLRDIHDEVTAIRGVTQEIAAKAGA